MKIIKQDSTRLQSVLWLGLPLSFGFTLVVTTALIAPILALTTAARYALPPSNPFVAYESILPGQPVNEVIKLGIACPLDTPNEVDARSRGTQYCLRSLETGAISRIGVYVAMDSLLVEQVFFIVRDNALTLGDLTLLWGKPRMGNLNGQRFKLYWDDRDVWAQTRPTDDRFSMFLQVERVVFTKENM